MPLMISSKVICPTPCMRIHDNLEYYELKKSEVEEDKEWICLFGHLAWYTEKHCFWPSLSWEWWPLQPRKVIVQTRADVESKMKSKADNAIFYISFKTYGGLDYNAIIRRTTDGMLEHMSLEVMCLI
ncbi:hypothetical protein V5N11_009845 [Cardamine amara subsp. amara]|uniref:Uncharacterized protein n=1 Tax=Cardamine amara subsp. amara TaxID=228776 RepID=A0ABD1AJN9_CARAN